MAKRIIEREAKIIAVFHPEAWVNDYAVDSEDAFNIDVTERVLAMGKDAALKVQDNSDETDALVQGLHKHRGPFGIEVEDAIQAYYASKEAK